jgi:hypothetical protein
MSNRLIAVIEQGEEESFAYGIETTNWGSAPSGMIVKAYDISDGGYTDVSSTVLSGSASIEGDIITLPVLSGLTAGKTYRIEIKFTAGGNTFEPFLIVECRK